MPTSDYHQIPDVLTALLQLNPNRILDVGIGFGKWGFLCRELLEIGRERYLRNDWKLTIDGIEIFEKYRTPIWDFAYNSVLIGDARKIMSNLYGYDVILCCDVIEHFKKEEGFHLLSKMLEASKVVILTSPIGKYEQGSYLGNEHERHLSIWERKDFLTWPYQYKEIGQTFMAVLSKDKSKIEKIKKERSRFHENSTKIRAFFSCLLQFSKRE